MADDLACVEPVEREESSSNGLGIRAWRDAVGTRLYDVHDAAKLLRLSYAGLHKRGLPTCRVGRQAFVSAALIESLRGELLLELGAAEGVRARRTDATQGHDTAPDSSPHDTERPRATEAGESSTPYLQRTEGAEPDAAARRIAELEAEVNGLVSDLRGAAAAEDTWKAMVLRRLPLMTEHD